MNGRRVGAKRFSISRGLKCFVILVISIFLVTFYIFVNQKMAHQLRGAAPSDRKFPIVQEAVQFDHAVIVAGHAVVHVDDLGEAQTRDEAWNLLAYQRGQGFPQIISSHIAAGVSVASEDSKAILLFSGGQTRKDAGPTSEAASYYYLAEQENLLNDNLNVVLEEYARDSFENVLFSICRFHEVTGNYPRHITVVGFDFKGPRFQNIIRKAVEYSRDAFDYVGVKPDAAGFDYEKAVKGEAVVYETALGDMYGCGSSSLLKKKLSRDPFHRTVPYELACPELTEFLRWCGPGSYKGKLPWKTA